MLNQKCVAMEEKKTNTENKMQELLERLEWEIPSLICLDKSKTESGPKTATYESAGYYDKAS